MVANRADLRSVFANDDVSAVAAFPNREVITDEYDSAFDGIEQFAISLLVMLLDFSDHPEFGGDFLEAFFFGDFGE